MPSVGSLLLLGRVFWRTYGTLGLRRRATHETRKALGLYRAVPRWPAIQTSREASPVYLPQASFDGLAEATKTRIRQRAQRVIEGFYEAFGHDWRPFPTDRDSWFRAPAGSYEFPDGAWWTVPHLPRAADIKEVWEPARFAWVYDLVRAFALTRDATLAQSFHRRLREWVEASPPFQGAHWSCGQETAIRAIAILHGEAAFGVDPDDPARLERVLAWSAERIEDAIGYGLSQRNNHGISESAGLIHLGARLRGHPRATTWLDLGRRLLDEQILDQFLSDGWYAQHSFNYQRVAMEQALLAQRVLERSGLSLSHRALARLEAAFDLMVATIDGDAGVMPNVGANDGARVLPLSSAPFGDFRPTMTLAALVLRRPLPMDVPADPEVLAWIGGQLPSATATRTDSVWRGRDSGWLVVRRGANVVSMRAGAMRHRPSHLDQLHVTMRAHGRDVLVDAGTYAYNAPPPWNNGLATAHAHNAPVLDDREPAAKGPRFLWADWPAATIVEVQERQESVTITAEVPGRVRRRVVVVGDGVTVEDLAIDPSVRTMQVTWLLPPDSDPSTIVAEGAVEITANEGAVDAWYSPSYLQRHPTRSVRTRRERRDDMPLRIETTIRPAARRE